MSVESNNIKTNPDTSGQKSRYLSIKRFKDWSVSLAESFDAWRIVPRLMLVSYGYLVWSLFVWYKSIPQYVQTKCDPAVLQILLDKGQKLDIARDLACNIIGSVGGPTGEQTLFVTTITGLSTGIFALYTTTGRPWHKENKEKKEKNTNDTE